MLENSFPVTVIANLVQNALRNCYDIDWQPRVVRQSKKLTVGTLEHIDYAVPLFEVSQQLGEPVLQVVETLTHRIRENLQTSSVNPLEPGWLRVEGVAGFINFELNEFYLRSSIQQAEQWFAESAGKQSGNRTRLLIVESEEMVSASDKHITDTTCSYLADLYKVLGRNMESSRVGQELTTETSRFLDELTIENDSIVKDDDNKAMYFTDGGDAVSLRSAKGRVYLSALVFYKVYDLLRQANEAEELLVIAPQKFHTFVYSIAACLEGDSHRVVCFDPKVSQANILRIEANKQSIADHLKTLQMILGTAAKLDLGDLLVRKDVLSLIDLPGELETFVSHKQLPALFDALDQSIVVLRRISRQEGV